MQHWSDPNALIQPDAPALAPLAADLRAQISPNSQPGQVLSQVEKFVYKKVPYEWDWNTWGMADYLPSVDEVLDMGREDCDGRAVVAASLLKNLGYDARLVTDFAHVWVWTPFGETMGPGKTRTVEVTDKGMRFNARGLLQIPHITSYGIAVFPVERELVLLAVFWLLLLGRVKVIRAFVALGVLTCGLFAVRYGAINYRGPQPLFEWAGWALLVLGVIFLLIRMKRSEGPEFMPQTEKTVATG